MNARMQRFTHYFESKYPVDSFAYGEEREDFRKALLGAFRYGFVYAEELADAKNHCIVKQEKHRDRMVDTTYGPYTYDEAKAKQKQLQDEDVNSAFMLSELEYFA